MEPRVKIDKNKQRFITNNNNFANLIGEIVDTFVQIKKSKGFMIKYLAR